jgi:hypothetical protein
VTNLACSKLCLKFGNHRFNRRDNLTNACPNEENCGLYDYEMVEGKGLKLIRKRTFAGLIWQ